MDKTIAQIISSKNTPFLDYDFDARKIRRNGKLMDLEVAKENLLILKKVFDKNAIRFWLLYGTLLGAVRENDFISHDTDTDLGVFIEDKNKIISAIPELCDFGLKPIRTKHPDDLLTFMRNDEYIDIGIFHRHQDIFFRKYYCYQDNRVYGEHFDAFDIVEFLGQGFLIPQKSAIFLKKSYGPKWRQSVANRPADEYVNYPVFIKLAKDSCYFKAFMNAIKKILYAHK